MNAELILSARMIANESASFTGNYFDNSAEKIKLFFDDVSTNVKKSMETLSNVANVSLTGTAESDIDKSVKDLNYLSVAALELPAPAGLKGDMSGYALALDIAVMVVSDIENQDLKPLMKELAKYYSNPNELASQNVKHQFKDWVSTLDNTKNRLAEYLDESTGVTKRPIRSLYSNLNGYKDTGKCVEGINKRLRMIDMDDILEYAERINDMFGRITNLSNQEGVTISNPVSNYLSDLAYMTACKLEFAASVIVKAQELSAVYNAQVVALKNYNRQM